MKDFLRRSAAGVLLFCAATAHAQQPYPSKPIRVVVAFTAGGTTDILAREVAQQMGKALGQSVVVENRPGAGGNIGTQAAARATPDGYTLLMTISSTQAINPSLYRSVPFDPVKDFEPIATVATVPNVLVVNPAFPARTMAELIALAKAKPDFYRYASAGNGTLNHLLGEMLNTTAGIKLEHVPYKGVAPALIDVLGSQVPMAFASLPSVLSHIK
ncbi:UNVERIFIED_CONTAM: tripartite tricarboxylate transporter substrate-binding protein, partial [Microbacterium sp. SLM126]